MAPRQRLFDLLRSQFGLATIWQALACGLTRDQIRRLVERGELRRPAHGIVAAGGAPETDSYRLMLGVLLGSSRSKDDGGVLSAICGPTAAVLHNFADRPLFPVHVLTTRRMRPHDGYRFHWTCRLPADEIVLVNGLPVTDAIRTVMDVCAIAPPRGIWMYRRGLREDRFKPEAVLARCQKEARQGREGPTLLRNIAAGVNETAGSAKSATEDYYFNLIAAAGLPLPERNIRVRGRSGRLWEVDLYYRHCTSGFEISPWLTHTDPWVYDKDALKIRDLAMARVKIYPITDGTTDAEFLQLVRDVLGAAA